MCLYRSSLHSNLVHALVLIVLGLRSSFSYADRKRRLTELLHSQKNFCSKYSGSGEVLVV